MPDTTNSPRLRAAVQNKHPSRLASFRRNRWREEMRNAREIREQKVLRSCPREKACFIDWPNAQTRRAGVSAMAIGI